MTNEPFDEQREVTMTEKAAIVVYTDSSHDLARVYRALGTAQEFVEAGDDVTVVFDGSGVDSLAALSSADHQLHPMLEALRPVVAGACGFCVHAHEVTEAVADGNWQLLTDHNGHASIRQLVVDGYTVITF